MQPRLKPVEKKYADMTKKWNEEGNKAVEEMLKRPSSLQEAMADLRRLIVERNKSKQ